MQNSGSRRYKLNMNPLGATMCGPWSLGPPMSKLLKHVGYFGSRIMAATKLVSVRRGSCSAGERIMMKLSHLWQNTIPSEPCSLSWLVVRGQKYTKWTSTLRFYTVLYQKKFTSNSQRDWRFLARRIGSAS